MEEEGLGAWTARERVGGKATLSSRSREAISGALVTARLCFPPLPGDWIESRGGVPDANGILPENAWGSAA